MAKADDTTSTTNWIWLREALALAVAVLGSAALAKEQLKEWLAAGKVPWSCMSWVGRAAEGIVDLLNLGSVAYYPGDPQFWGAGHLNIDWEDNGARERRAGGAHALGIKVSRAHVLALLPKEPSEREEVRGAGAWIAQEASRMKAAGKISDGIKITDLAKELERRMKAAAAVDVRFARSGGSTSRISCLSGASGRLVPSNKLRRILARI
jgi:hypothetical protein